MSKFFMTIFFNLLIISLLAQSNISEPVLLHIASNKTTSIVFPQIIKAIDRGSQDLFIQKVNGAENVLQIKAAKEIFPETNLTVITEDGKLYEFSVCYAENPSQLVFRMDTVQSIYELVVQKKRIMRRPRDVAYEMRLRLRGIFIKDGILYFQLELQNFSNISYGIDAIRFYTTAKKQSKRTAIQQLDQIPLSLYQSHPTVQGQSNQVFVAAFNQFTIPDKQLFYMQVTEKNGGRNLLLKITNRNIVNAKLI